MLCRIPTTDRIELVSITRFISHLTGLGSTVALSNAISITGTSSSSASTMIMIGVSA
jgi:hypothetical protein